jgi:cytochrome c-type biogenesis protein CcmE
MTPKRKQRLMFVIFLLVGIGAAAALAITAFNENMLYFYKPSQVLAGEAPGNHVFRLGGLVEKNSVQRQAGSLRVEFVVTDMVQSIPVYYDGILPDLFREGQGIIALGRLNADGVFVADEVLAKHDENYMPPEVAEALQDSAAEQEAQRQ